MHAHLPHFSLPVAVGRTRELVAVEKAIVEVEVQGEQSAVADIRRVETALERLQREADEAVQKQRLARSGRIANRTQFLKMGGVDIADWSPSRGGTAGLQFRESDVAFGAFKLGGRGFQVRNAAMRMGGRVAAGFALTHAAAGVLNQAANVRDVVNDALAQNWEAGRLAREAGGTLARGITEQVAAVTGLRRLAEGTARIVGGLSEEDARNMIEDIFDSMFSSRERIRERDEERRRQMRERQDAAERKVWESFGALDYAVPKGIELLTEGGARTFINHAKHLPGPDGRSNYQRTRDEAQRARETAKAMPENEGR